MRLVSFSVTNFRSITSANRIHIGDKTVLIGPNNEGKSNLLQALRASMALVEIFARPTSQQPPIMLRRYYREIYNWESDFPISLQDKKPNGQTVFRLEFYLTDNEIDDFRSEIKSNLNGTLPIELRIGKKEEPSFKVLKRGPGGPALSSKANQIARFVGGRIDFNYIPTIRTAESASEVVAQMVARRLATLDEDPEYQKALAKIGELQEPLLQDIAQEVASTLRQFLPDVAEVTVSIPERMRYRIYKRDCEIIVDDGTPTLLERKGDGVKSLAAISLLHGSAPTKPTSILALEEPESHLHPNAIHTLKEILDELSAKTQLVLTTHNPLFIDRSIVRNNVLVNERSARPATDIEQIRRLLGVRVSDNLLNSRIALIVEGKSDERALRSILSRRSKVLKGAIDNGDLVFDSLSGASKLTYKLSALQLALCVTHVFLDHDDAGRSSVEVALAEDLVKEADCQFAICKGMLDSELEDCYRRQVYESEIQARFGVKLNVPEFRSSKIWSERMRATFLSQGRTWNDSVKARVKSTVANIVAESDADVVEPSRSGSIEALVEALEQKVEGLDAEQP